MRSRAGAALSLALLTLTLAACASRAAASSANPPHYTRVPCPAGIRPDRITVSWRFQIGVQHPYGGYRMVRDPGVVRRFYRGMCNTLLVHFAHPVSISCLDAYGEFIYHLNFLSRGRPLLSIKEDVSGCAFYWVEGKRKLGTAYGTYLPRGIPPPPR